MASKMHRSRRNTQMNATETAILGLRRDVLTALVVAHAPHDDTGRGVVACDAAPAVEARVIDEPVGVGDPLLAASAVVEVDQRLTLVANHKHTTAASKSRQDVLNQHTRNPVREHADVQTKSTTT